MEGACLRDLTLSAACLRLSCAMLFGGLIGLERERKHRPAGFRTYMLVCLGSTLAMLLGLYNSQMLRTLWAGNAASADVARIGAQVINGIGFLGAGTVIVTGRQETKGVTTAAGLWASACMGLAIGAGFYEGMALGFALIWLCVVIFPYLENYFLAYSRNINLYIELDRIQHLGEVINWLKGRKIKIYEVELDRDSKEACGRPSAVLLLNLPNRQPHAIFLAELSKISSIWRIDEI